MPPPGRQPADCHQRYGGGGSTSDDATLNADGMPVDPEDDLMPGAAS